MFTDAFIEIEHGIAAKILDQLNPLLDGAPFDSSMVRILSHSLPFYEGYSLVEVTDHDVNPPRQISFIYKDQGNKEGDKDRIFILNGKNDPIYHLNKVVPILLNEDLVTLYVRFFFTYVRGSYGRFLIVENVDEIDWKEEPALSGRNALGKMISSVQLKSAVNDGDYQLSANIIFKNSLFESDIAVETNGNVTLSNQELLVEDIPVLDDSFGQ